MAEREPDPVVQVRRRLRTPLVVLLAFGVSAGLTSVVSAAVGGSQSTFVGDGDPNSVFGGEGNDTMSGGESNDYFRGSGGGDVLNGEGDDDTLIGDNAGMVFNDSLNGGEGNDELAGFGGDDVISGGDGDDILGSIDFSKFGGTYTTEYGDDSLYGGPGNDVVLAGTGSDLLRGDAGWDTLRGEDGDDWLEPGEGDDVAVGGPGTDKVAYPSAWSRIVIDLVAGTVTGAAGSDSLEGIENAEGGNGHDAVSGDSGPNGLAGGWGDDTIDGGTGADVLDGSHGADLLRTTSTDVGDSLYGGPGNDRVEAQNGIADTVDCGEELDGSTDADVAVVDAVDTVSNCEAIEAPDTAAPNTRITSGPAEVIRTRKRSIEVTFKFKSNEQGSTFKCRLDGARFKPCTSPTTVKLSRGAHVFQVRATDAAGNVDPTPASHEVVVKRKRG